MRTAIDPSLHRRSTMKSNPYSGAQQLLLAKVINLHPAQGTVDVAIDGASGQGGFYNNVPVMSWSAGTQTGSSYFPSVDLSAPIPNANGVYDQPLPSGKQDAWCVVGHLNSRSQRPVVLGFLHPFDSKVRSSDIGDHVEVHESGVYGVTTKDGHFEKHFPDGSYVIVSPDNIPANMTQKNPNWDPATTTAPYNLIVNLAQQGIAISMQNGNVNISGAKQIQLATQDTSGDSASITINGAGSVTASKTVSGTTTTNILV